MLWGMLINCNLEIVHYWNQLQQIATVWTASNETTGGIFQVTSGSWERRTTTECTGRCALKGERREAAGQAVKMAMVGISIERDCSVRAEINVERRGQSTSGKNLRGTGLSCSSFWVSAFNQVHRSNNCLEDKA